MKSREKWCQKESNKLAKSNLKNVPRSLFWDFGPVWGELTIWSFLRRGTVDLKLKKKIGKMRPESRPHVFLGGGTSEEAWLGWGIGACKFVDVCLARFAPWRGAADLLMWPEASHRRPPILYLCGLGSRWHQRAVYRGGKVDGCNRWPAGSCQIPCHFLQFVWQCWRIKGGNVWSEAKGSQFVKRSQSEPKGYQKMTKVF